MYTEVSAWTQSFEICISDANEIFPEIKKLTTQVQVTGS